MTLPKLLVDNSILGIVPGGGGIGTSTGDHKVATSSIDSSPGYLLTKIKGGTNVSTSEVTDSGTKKVQIDVTIPSKPDWKIDLTPNSMNIPTTTGYFPAVVSNFSIGGFNVGESAGYDDALFTQYLYGQFPVESDVTGNLNIEIGGKADVPDVTANKFQYEFSYCVVIQGSNESIVGWQSFNSGDLVASSTGTVEIHTWPIASLVSLGIPAGCKIFWRLTRIAPTSYPDASALVGKWQVQFMTISAPRV